MRLLSLTICIGMLICTNAFADVSIEITDLQKKIMRITHTFENEDSGLTNQIYPDSGYKFATNPINVVSVTELDSLRELDYQVVKIPQGDGTFLQAVKINFQNPIPEGGSIRLRVSVEAPTDNIKLDLNGRYEFSYTTSHKATFVVPQGHAIVFSSFPVFIYERKGKTVAKVKEIDNLPDAKHLIFNTRNLIGDMK